MLQSIRSLMDRGCELSAIGVHSDHIQALSGAQLALCCTRARQAIDTKRGLGHAALDSLDIKLDILLVYTQI